MGTPNPIAPAAHGHFRKRIVIPTAFIVVVLAFLLWEAVRGSWTDSDPRNPASAADNPMTQILRTDQGHKEVRAALIVASPPEAVWNVVTDYDHFAEIFPYVGTSKGVRDSDRRWHLTGEVRSLIGSWPIDVHVRHDEQPARMAASWDEPSGALKVNRGSWVVSQRGSGETLLEYHLELTVAPFPDFVVRAVLLDQLKPVMKAVARRAQRDQAAR